MSDQIDQIFVTALHWILGFLPVAWRPLVSALICITVILSVFPGVFAITTIFERKGIGRIQKRYGPNRVAVRVRAVHSGRGEIADQGGHRAAGGGQDRAFSRAHCDAHAGAARVRGAAVWAPHDGGGLRRGAAVLLAGPATTNTRSWAPCAPSRR
jgi:hypothetical protein